MTYEEALIQTENSNMIVLEKDLMFDLKGLYIDGLIIIDNKTKVKLHPCLLYVFLCYLYA